MTKYLVTGGAGFIGSHVAEELVRRGHKVTVLDNFFTGKRENIAPFMDKIELIEGDIRDMDICRQSLEDVDFVLHQAALPSVPRSIEDPVLASEINIQGTLNLLVASRDAGIKKFVFASSTSVYGDDPSLPKEEGREGKPLSPYAVSKIAGEMYCQVFSRIYGLSTVCLRYFNVFGPRQDPFSQYAAVIPNFITKTLKGESSTIFGDGEQSRDFTYVSNVVEANFLAAEAQNVTGEIFNIACGEKTSVNSLAKKINELLGKDISPVHDEPRPGDILHSLADISKAKKMLKYDPLVSIDEGLEKTIRWFQEEE
ncbi:MAG: SDR family oxidoreductase [Candidatus Aminicenantes bacterium]|nr:MAG: SDR family oxidoreductase [Candidatus Aminicenantes bacterium]